MPEPRCATMWLALAVASLLLVATDGATRKPRLIAKVSSTHCDTISTADADTAVSTLSAAAVSRVSTAAAAVGLSYNSSMPVSCWVLLNSADSAEATAAAIQTLLAGPSVSVASDGVTTAAADQPVFETIGEDRRLPLPRVRRQIGRSQRSPNPPTPNATKQRLIIDVPSPLQQRHRRRRNGTVSRAAARPWRVVPGSAVAPASLPTECATGTCTRLWGMNRIKAPDAWAAIGNPMPPMTRKGTIVDAGVDMKHYDISPQIDVASSVTYASDVGNRPKGGVAAKEEHGTHVFGTAAGGWGPYNGQIDPNGIAGVAGPSQNQMISCNIFGTGEDAFDSDIIKCIKYAQTKRAHYAVNLSIGGQDEKGGAMEKLYRDLFKSFCADGGMAIVAAGNGNCIGTGCPDNYDYYKGVDVSFSGLDTDGTTMDTTVAAFPAYLAKFFPDCVIAVANIDKGDKLDITSNWGDVVQLAAPGDDILSDVLTSQGGNWARGMLSGTSMSAPHVTGAVLLLRNSFPDATNTQVSNCLFTTSEKTVKPYWPGTYIKGGVMNVKAAYDCLKALFSGGPAPPASPAPAPSPKSPSPSPAPPTTDIITCGECSPPNVCTEDDGCYCEYESYDYNEGVCTCNTDMGLMEYLMDSDEEGPTSSCIWNLAFPKTGYVRSARGARVSLDFNVLADKTKICPDTNVIDSVAVDTDTGLFKCPSGNYTALSRSTAALGAESCSRTKLSKYTFTAISAGARGTATRNMCANLKVTTTDGVEWRMILQYTT